MPETFARTGSRASSASRNCSNAPVVTTKPGGTWMPACVSSPSDPPLPPTVGRSAMPTSENQTTEFMARSSPLAGRWQREALTEGALLQAQRGRRAPSTMLRMVPLPVPGRTQRILPSRLFQHPLVAGLVFEDGHDPAPAVDADALAVLDPLRRLARPDYRRQVVLTRDNGHVAHRPADVADRRADA